jgi:hypothetical protein
MKKQLYYLVAFWNCLLKKRFARTRAGRKISKNATGVTGVHETCVALQTFAIGTLAVMAIWVHWFRIRQLLMPGSK